jgi:hypothetical protein
MWPLKKPDPDIEVTPEDAFVLTAVMSLGYVLWTVVFPWWPVVKH